MLNEKKIQELKDRIDERLAARGQNQPDTTRWVPPAGKSIIRILPVLTEDALPVKEVGIHYTSSGGHTCPNVTLHQECPICKMVDELKKSKLEADQKFARDLEVQVKGAWWIVDRADESQPKVWVASTKIYNQLIGLLVSREFGDFTDPTKGRDFLLNNDAGKRDPYTIFPKDPSPVFVDANKFREIINQMKPIESMFRCMTPDKLAALVTAEQSVEAIAEQKQVQTATKTEQSKPVDSTKEQNPACFGEYGENDPECSPDKCTHRKACAKATAAKSGASAPSEPDKKEGTSTSTGDSLDDVLKEVHDMNKKQG